MQRTVGGRKSLHDHSLKTVIICVHCTQIFTLCTNLDCKDLRPPLYPAENLIHCCISDELGMNRPLFKSRSCDEIEDFPNGVDESVLENRESGALNKSLLQPFDINLVYKPQSLLTNELDLDIHTLTAVTLGLIILSRIVLYYCDKLIKIFLALQTFP